MRYYATTTAPQYKTKGCLFFLCGSASDVYDPSISDHFVVSCMLSLPKTSFERKEICCRKLKSIDMQTFRDEISNSALASPSSIVDDLEQLTAVYDLTLSSLVEKHAP